MQRMFTRYISIVIMISSVLISLLAWNSLERIAYETAEKTLQAKLTQIVEKLESNEKDLENLTDSLNEDYLTRAYAFAYIIEKNPEVIESLSELEKIKKLLNVDELHVVDENGILIAGSIPKYVGMDFHSTKQTSEFLKILNNDIDELVQDIQPNGAEQKIFQYVGVKRQDKEGVVQIGLAPTRLLDAKKKNEISYVIENLQLGNNIHIGVIDSASELIASSKKNLTKSPFSYADSYDYYDGKKITILNDRELCMTKKYDNLMLFASMPESEIFKNQYSQIMILVSCMIGIAIITIIVINQLIKKNIIDGVQHLKDDLNSITQGNLNTVVKVNNNPEFTQISKAINQMVKSILNTTVKISKIIDAIDLPIGVFEIRKDDKNVLINDRLIQILEWNEEEKQAYLSDKNRFLDKLNQMLKEDHPNNIYKLDVQSEKWIQFYMNEDDDSIFGMIQDVTNNIHEKHLIQYQRDHDHLTGLNTMHHFLKLAKEQLGLHANQVNAMVMLDLDFFKDINDTFGHDWGDTYLKSLAKVLSSMENDHCIVARRSGDEFCMFFYGYSSQDEIRTELEKFYQFLHEHTLIFPDGMQQEIRISAGLSWYINRMNMETLLKQADTALYESKHHCRGQLSEWHR